MVLQNLEERIQEEFGKKTIELDLSKRKLIKLLKLGAELSGKTILDASQAFLKTFKTEFHLNECSLSMYDEKTKISVKGDHSPLYSGITKTLEKPKIFEELEEEKIHLPIYSKDKTYGHLSFKTEKFSIKNISLMKAYIKELGKFVPTAVELSKRSKQVLTDSLTGVYSRRGLEEISVNLMKDVERTGNPLSIIFADITHFKEINDTYGHAYGDSVLQKFAYLLNKNVKHQDYVARYGGDEFIILLPNTNLEKAKEIHERLYEVIANIHLHNSLDDELSLKEYFNKLDSHSVLSSLGIASTETLSKNELNFNNLITEADKGMYEQKHNQHDQPLEFKEKYVGTRMFEQYDYDVISNNVIKQYKNDKKLIFTVFYATNLKEREEKENSSKVWNEYAIALNELTSCVNKYSKTVITGAKPSTDYCIAVYLEEDHNPVKDLEKGVSEVLKKYHKKTSTGINFSAGSAIFDPEFTKPEVYQNLVNFPRNLEKLALDNAIETKEKELSSSVFK